MKNFIKSDLLGQIVATFPGAGDYFMVNHIDFCCGGERSLETALSGMENDVDEILAGLNTLYEKFQKDEVQFEDWAKSDKQSLINHILKEHHQFLKEELPAISVLLFKLLGVHGKQHEELFEVHKKFNMLRTELESHLVKEEVWLFPALIQYEITKQPILLKELETLVETIESEHVGAGDLLKSLRAITNHYTVPKDACTTYALTLTKLQALEKNTFEHIHLENNILLRR